MKSEIEEHLDRAEEFLRAADVLSTNELPTIAIGRAYYAMFHAATAALLQKEIQRSSHHALISAFGQFLVKPGLIHQRFHVYLQDAFDARGDSDYGPTPSASAEMVAMQIERAREFIGVCREFCA